MNKRTLMIPAALACLLSGCLEVEQHPPYANGAYAGERDNRAADVSFKGDNAAWKTAVDLRNRGQNEYNRVHP